MSLPGPANAYCSDCCTFVWICTDRTGKMNAKHNCTPINAELAALRKVQRKVPSTVEAGRDGK